MIQASAVSLADIQAIFVAPHFDDVALSCGGIVARTVAEGGPSLIVTVFAGEPSQDAPLSAFAHFQHDRWGTADETAATRQREDATATALLGATYHWLPYHDAIYRGDQYLSDDDLFGTVKPEDAPLVERVAADLVTLWRQTADALVYLPLAVGNHVDHQICYATAETLRSVGAVVWFYEDFPYAVLSDAVETRLRTLNRSSVPRVIDVSDYLNHRLNAMAAYPSQLPTIFRHYGPYDEVTRRYATALASGNGRFGERVWSLHDPSASPDQP